MAVHTQYQVRAAWGAGWFNASSEPPRRRQYSSLLNISQSNESLLVTYAGTSGAVGLLRGVFTTPCIIRHGFIRNGSRYVILKTVFSSPGDLWERGLQWYLTKILRGRFDIDNSGPKLFGEWPLSFEICVFVDGCWKDWLLFWIYSVFKLTHIVYCLAKS